MKVKVALRSKKAEEKIAQQNQRVLSGKNTQYGGGSLQQELTGAQGSFDRNCQRCGLCHYGM